jgi:hypothetical protein
MCKIIFLFLGLFSAAYAQEVPNAYSLTQTDIYELRFYEALRKLREHEKHYQSDKGQLSMFYQVLAAVYTFNGMPDSAMVAMDRSAAMFQRSTDMLHHAQDDDTIFDGYHAVPAKSYIVEQADKYKTIMLNEAHTVPQHRVLTKSILKELYNKGYRVLCFETMREDNAALDNKPASWQDYHPLYRWKRGYYTKEPVFAELIRDADRIGYTIYGYEPARAPNRDSMMAVNLQKILHEHPNDKMIVHAGYGHISKTTSKSMYNYFKILTGIDALTINQTTFYEHSKEYYEGRYDKESSYYMTFKEHFSTAVPVVLMDSIGNLFKPEDSRMDVYVFSPPDSLLYNRPQWIFEQGARKAILLKKLRKPSVVKAYYANEVSIHASKYDEFHIPVDILTIENIKKIRYYLALPEGIFFIQYLDLQGNIYKEYYYQVKL